MELNSDFSQRIVVHSDRLEWIPSPMAGVERRMLDRIGDEVARATTIVRYAPNSKFSSHVHSGGEEFLVLEGVFQDEHGDYPAGSYVRNPPQSKHIPRSENGCVIFVKLWQFNLQDRHQVCIRPDDMTFKDDPQRSGVLVTPLFQDEREEVCLEQWLPNTTVKINAPKGAELLVLEGSFFEEGDELALTPKGKPSDKDTAPYMTNSWLRVPIDSQIVAKTGAKGAKVWLKKGHLPFISVPKIENIR